MVFLFSFLNGKNILTILFPSDNYCLLLIIIKKFSSWLSHILRIDYVALSCLIIFYINKILVFLNLDLFNLLFLSFFTNQKLFLLPTYLYSGTSSLLLLYGFLSPSSSFFIFLLQSLLT